MKAVTGRSREAHGASRTGRAMDRVRQSHAGVRTRDDRGTVGDTGIAGLTLGGGFGWLEAAAHGMTVDNLLGADLVLAERRTVHGQRRAENADLFWALRGGGGNFGVVTCLRIPAASRSGRWSSAAWSCIRIERAVRCCGSTGLMATAPDDLTVAAGTVDRPDGHKACAMVAAYAGSVEEG